ncbi:hypothetical protein JKP88DRAFT_271011 [Tribonema minus]|uniref:Fe-S oxidoreductase n=1 Tax=Tribonema minus TaxID=303371 RepID=A0A836C7A2_9STRA|nr:hypothetical protein JKP88DRAFT_271011 [Tribonema minus]
MSTGAEQREVPVTPDFNTPVEVDKLRLSTPKAPPARAAEPAAKWAGLDGLDERTTGSLVPDTLKQMGEDEEFQATAARLRALGAARMTLEEKKLRRRALDELGLPSFQQYLARAGLAVPRATSTILQLNIGLYCNQACAHCHVESSPRRTESMSREVAERCLVVLRASGGVATLDITGGAPELNPQFRYLVEQASALGVEIIDRCNLTVLQEPGQEDLAEFLAKHKVRVVASLPCYSPKNVNTQRGSGVFDRSILGLRQLNALGYGVEGSGLSLDLVYNPLGAFLPPPQEALEAKYKEELMEAFGITFNSLFTITNMPIKRFADFLYRRGELKDYMELLVRNFNPAATKGLMCKDTVSVGWDGRIFDCDFNQQLGLGMGTAGTNEDAPFDLKTMGDVGYSIFDVDSLDELASTKIVLESHCFGCTSGMGSSCQGATS